MAVRSVVNVLYMFTVITRVFIFPKRFIFQSTALGTAHETHHAM
jgi:hypothetical protein